jgi:hypothetical protein
MSPPGWTGSSFKLTGGPPVATACTCVTITRSRFARSISFTLFGSNDSMPDSAYGTRNSGALPGAATYWSSACLSAAGSAALPALASSWIETDAGVCPGVKRTSRFTLWNPGLASFNMTPPALRSSVLENSAPASNWN